MLLTYGAIDNAGKAQKDSIEAPNPREAIEQLRRRGLYVTEIHESSARESKVRGTLAPALPGRLPLKTLSQFTRQMAMLLRSGSGLVPAMQAIRRQLRHRGQIALLQQIITDLEDGSTLTDALRKHPRTFDAVFCAIIAAGEASGTLTEMFERLSVIVAKRRTMQKKVLGALAYPILLILMSFQIILALLLFVLPRFAGMFEQLGVEPPGTTLVMLQAGAMVRDYWPVLVVLAVGGVGAIVATLRTTLGRQWISDMQILPPLLGKLRSRLIQGQVFRTMGMLLESGVGVLDALDLVRASTNNRRFQRLFDHLEETVTGGGLLSTPFEQSGLIDPAICQAVHTGEESGHLGEAMTFSADTLDENNEELITVITRLIEPIILVGMGVVVGGVAISLFMPLFDLTSAIR